MLFDAHTHLNEEDFTDEERTERIREIEEDPQLEGVVDIGCDVPSSVMAARHAAAYPWCFAAVGVHPHAAGTMTEEDLKEIRRLAGLPGVCAIGEIGLDYHYDNAPREAQQAWFRRQIALALELEMPIVIHSREADRQTMDILIEEGAFSEERREHFAPRTVLAGWEAAAPSAGVVIHCFSGSAELAAEYVRLGADIGIAGPVTYKNNKKTIRVVEQIPPAFLMAETDAPYLAPEPRRGRPNKSAFVGYTVKKMAAVAGISFEEMASVTAANAKRFYRL